jgi:hypothetical protein
LLKICFLKETIGILSSTSRNFFNSHLRMTFNVLSAVNTATYYRTRFPVRKKMLVGLGGEGKFIFKIKWASLIFSISPTFIISSLKWFVHVLLFLHTRSVFLSVSGHSIISCRFNFLIHYVANTSKAHFLLVSPSSQIRHWGNICLYFVKERLLLHSLWQNSLTPGTSYSGVLCIWETKVFFDITCSSVTLLCSLHCPKLLFCLWYTLIALSVWLYLLSSLKCRMAKRTRSWMPQIQLLYALQYSYIRYCVPYVLIDFLFLHYFIVISLLKCSHLRLRTFESISFSLRSNFHWNYSFSTK